jgi:hypothetical protein
VDQHRCADGQSVRVALIARPVTNKKITEESP